MATTTEILRFSAVLATLILLAAGFWGFIAPALLGGFAPLVAFLFVMGMIIYGTVNA